MLIRIITIGNKMPAWVDTGFKEYAKRFTGRCLLELHEIPAEKRTKNADIPKIIREEGDKILKIIKPQHRLIALDVQGQLLSTEALSKELHHWQQEGRHLDLVIGGADGLSSIILQKAEFKWSLSPLTLPHPLVRIILAEQLYRAESILQNHPYHR